MTEQHTDGPGQRAAAPASAVRCAADVREVWRRHMGDQQVPVPSARDWLVQAYRARAESLALRLVDLSADPLREPDELLEDWRRAGVALRGALAELHNALGE